MEQEADGGKSCCCLFSQIIYSNTGRNLLFICAFCLKVIVLLFGGRRSLCGIVWNDHEVTGKQRSLIRSAVYFCCTLIISFDSQCVQNNIKAESLQTLLLYKVCSGGGGDGF